MILHSFVNVCKVEMQLFEQGVPYLLCAIAKQLHNETTDFNGIFLLMLPSLTLTVADK